jgi:hypothetical protein
MLNMTFIRLKSGAHTDKTDRWTDTQRTNKQTHRDTPTQGVFTIYILKLVEPNALDKTSLPYSISSLLVGSIVNESCNKFPFSSQ